MERNLYRVSYVENGMPKVAFVVAELEAEASYFIGIAAQAKPPTVSGESSLGRGTILSSFLIRILSAFSDSAT